VLVDHVVVDKQSQAYASITFNRVTVKFRCATSDLMLIQQNKFY